MEQKVGNTSYNLEALVGVSEVEFCKKFKGLNPYPYDSLKEVYAVLKPNIPKVEKTKVVKKK